MARARDNPFSTHRVVRERYRLSAQEWDALLERLDHLGRRGAIVGPHGSGKTTLLEDLAGRLEARGARITLLRFNTSQRRLAQSRMVWTAGDVILCDGAEQLSLPDWWRLKIAGRRAGGLVITTHRAGRLPVLHECRTSPELLCTLVASLGVAVEARECERLHARHGGNIRDALRELYDRCAMGSDTSDVSDPIAIA